MHEVKGKLKELRPSLRLVAPLTWTIILGFGILNLVLGWSLMHYPLGTPLAIVSDYTPLQLYGAMFIALGVAMLLNLWRNNWRWLRRLLLIGLLIKTIWLFALVMRLFNGGSAIILVLWMFITHVQAMAYVYFIPIQKGGSDVGANRDSSSVPRD